MNPCEKCVYFKPGNYTRTGTCTRYVAYRGRGKLVYEFSESVRLDKSKCGPEGKLFLSASGKDEKVNINSIIWLLMNDDE
jgi:hypothetical protein